MLCTAVVQGSTVDFVLISDVGTYVHLTRLIQQLTSIKSCSAFMKQNCKNENHKQGIISYNVMQTTNGILLVCTLNTPVL